MNTTHAASASALVIAALIERLVIALTPITAAARLLRITPLADCAGLRIEGELDRSTLPALRRALASMASDGFCVDLSGLTFIDTACLRALVSAATALHDGGGDRVLTLRSVPPQVRRLLELTGWHQTPGLRLQAPARPGRPTPGRPHS
ncbi:STAS domain-containing protein [Nonomuraea aurantiaca]|uniref:STAS domain-containing protein n=1 Tax=Nonomuraea aurantiaca TaxID=2878562 RepID=UPI001CD9F185|nr:STAS domain-containing protein [Nonomuraea aurantiaca]MCA2222953.1 STAS domain-containing protein [Nonomuraea aurantiaca]